jgi:hypothetical protein
MRFTVATAALFIFALVSCILTPSAYAHMSMRYPAPRRSKFLPGIPESSVDYSMTAPLDANGSNFPCKQYPKSNLLGANLTAGDTVNVQMDGVTFHRGGHCQFSISYNGIDFVAIHTVMKTCFVGTGLSINVQVPASAPACESCVFAWSWVNAAGNREFYMNCADVSIRNPSPSNGLNGPRMVVANLPGYPEVYLCHTNY